MNLLECRVNLLSILTSLENGFFYARNNRLIKIGELKMKKENEKPDVTLDDEIRRIYPDRVEEIRSDNGITYNRRFFEICLDRIISSQEFDAIAMILDQRISGGAYFAQEIYEDEILKEIKSAFPVKIDLDELIEMYDLDVETSNLGVYKPVRPKKGLIGKFFGLYPITEVCKFEIPKQDIEKDLGRSISDEEHRIFVERYNEWIKSDFDESFCNEYKELIRRTRDDEIELK